MVPPSRTAWLDHLWTARSPSPVAFVAMWMGAFALLLALPALAGCGAASSGNDTPIDKAAWTAAGVDHPEFQLGDDGVLHAEVDTSLPIDDTDDRGAGFAERAAQIVWRTYPGRFDVLELTVGHDGVALVTEEYPRADLERRLGPRPAALDDGVERTDAAADADGEFADLEAAGTVAAVQTELLEPVIRRTLDELFNAPDATIEFGEPEECLGGLTGNEPTGEFRAGGGSGVMPVDGSPLATLPALADYWRGLGLDVDTSNFDTGLDMINVVFDGRGSILAKASDGGVSLSGFTDCLDVA